MCNNRYPAWKKNNPIISGSAVSGELPSGIQMCPLCKNNLELYITPGGLHLCGKCGYNPKTGERVITTSPTTW